MSRLFWHLQESEVDGFPLFLRLFRMTVLRSLESNALPQAFRAYVGLVDYIKAVYRETDAIKGGNEGGNGMVALTTQLVGMANGVWNSLVKVLST